MKIHWEGKDKIYYLVIVRLIDCRNLLMKRKLNDNKKVHRQTDRQTDRQTGRQAGRQTDRQTDRQIVQCLIDQGHSFAV